MFGAVSVQMQYQSMEIMDRMDEFPLAYCNGKEENTHYVRGRHNGWPMNLPYKEEVDGSSPFAPTEKPLNTGVF